MSGINGDYTSLAEACGEREPSPTVWIPGQDFDPRDADEMEIMRDVWANEKDAKIARLEAENAELHRRLAAMNNAMYDAMD